MLCVPPFFISLFAATLMGCLAQESGAQEACPDGSWLASVTVIRTILKDGFHRELVTTVDLGTFTNTAIGCNVLIKEQFPTGLYVDPYQLASLREHGVLETLVMSPVDVEAPEYLSTKHSVLVYMKPDPRCARCFSATVPVHGRYHRPSEDKEVAAIITLENPKLLVHCYKGLPSQECWKHNEEDAPCTVENRTFCHWSELQYNPISEGLTLQVPVGHKHHLLAVSAVTLLVTVMCCGLIVRVVYRHGHFQV